MPTYFVGIDVSKFKHTCCIINENGEVIKKSFDFSNSKEGFDSLIEIFKSIDQTDSSFQIVMEATGHYHECKREFEGVKCGAKDKLIILWHEI